MIGLSWILILPSRMNHLIPSSREEGQYVCVWAVHARYSWRQPPAPLGVVLKVCTNLECSVGPQVESTHGLSANME